jgi:hypothetical protein
MAVPPKFAAHRLTFADAPPSTTSSVPFTRHTLEIYLDYCCPWSGKIFLMLTSTVIPAIKSNSTWAANLEIIFRHQVQPWHPQSTMMHEAALAVLAIDPSRFWAFSEALFKVQPEFFDVNSCAESRNDMYRRLSKVAAGVGVYEATMMEMLTVPDKPVDGSLNMGNKVTNDMKVLVKMARLVGIHVSPTVVFDGVVRNDISSGWTKEQWEEFLGTNVV